MMWWQHEPWLDITVQAQECRWRARHKQMCNITKCAFDYTTFCVCNIILLILILKPWVKLTCMKYDASAGCKVQDAECQTQTRLSVAIWKSLCIQLSYQPTHRGRGYCVQCEKRAAQNAGIFVRPWFAHGRFACHVWVINQTVELFVLRRLLNVTVPKTKVWRS